MELDHSIRHRWSPREYRNEPIPAEKLRAVFEAARWAQSSNNEQPWRYLIAFKNGGAARTELESYLMDGNAFAKEAYVLGLSFAKKTFTKHGQPNRTSFHDLGAASQLLALAAWDQGLNTRFMGGFHVDKARAAAPDDFDPVAMFVIGYATPAGLTSPGRSRHDVSAFVFENRFGEAWRG